MPKVAIIRVRGRTGLRKEIKATLRLLRLNRINHCVVVPATSQNMGMVKKCKDYVTWGELDKDTFTILLQKRGRLGGNRRLGEADIKASGFDSFESFAEKFMNGETGLDSIKGLKPVFRLHPPRKGYGRIKKRYPNGALGYRGTEINALIRRMV